MPVERISPAGANCLYNQPRPSQEKAEENIPFSSLPWSASASFLGSALSSQLSLLLCSVAPACLTSTPAPPHVGYFPYVQAIPIHTLLAGCDGGGGEDTRGATPSYSAGVVSRGIGRAGHWL